RVFSYAISDGIIEIDRAGDMVNAQPKWTGNATFGYRVDKFNAFMDVNYVGSGKYDVTFTNPTDINDNTIGSRVFVNTQLSYDFGNGENRREVFVAISNLFNERPPAIFVYSGGPNYDRIGRAIRAGFRFRLWVEPPDRRHRWTGPRTTVSGGERWSLAGSTQADCLTQLSPMPSAGCGAPPPRTRASMRAPTSGSTLFQ